MFMVLNFEPKRIRVTVHQSNYSIAAFLSIGFQVVAADTVTAITSEVESEAVTIKFKAA